jgi:hypothetical protein
LSETQKKEYLQVRKPKYLYPRKENYTIYMDEIKACTDSHPNEEILSIQAFACHGIIMEGSQRCLINNYDDDRSFYELINVESTIRIKAMSMPNVFFLVLFACCREGYTSKKVIQNSLATRNGLSNIDMKPANFTMIFGCDPASGVPANTKLVKLIVEHLLEQFDPEDGSALLPDCFGVIDAM